MIGAAGTAAWTHRPTVLQHGSVASPWFPLNSLVPSANGLGGLLPRKPRKERGPHPPHTAPHHRYNLPPLGVTAQVLWVRDDDQQAEGHLTLRRRSRSIKYFLDVRAVASQPQLQDEPEPRPGHAGGNAPRASSVWCTWRWSTPGGRPSRSCRLHQERHPIERPVHCRRIATEHCECGSTPHRARTAGFGQRRCPSPDALGIHRRPEAPGTIQPFAGGRRPAQKPA